MDNTVDVTELGPYGHATRYHCPPVHGEEWGLLLDRWHLTARSHEHDDGATAREPYLVAVLDFGWASRGARRPYVLLVGRLREPLLSGVRALELPEWLCSTVFVFVPLRVDSEAGAREVARRVVQGFVAGDLPWPVGGPGSERASAWTAAALAHVAAVM